MAERDERQTATTAITTTKKTTISNKQEIEKFYLELLEYESEIEEVSSTQRKFDQWDEIPDSEVLVVVSKPKLSAPLSAEEHLSLLQCALWGGLASIVFFGLLWKVRGKPKPDKPLHKSQPPPSVHVTTDFSETTTTRTNFQQSSPNDSNNKEITYDLYDEGAIAFCLSQDDPLGENLNAPNEPILSDENLQQESTLSVSVAHTETTRTAVTLQQRSTPLSPTTLAHQEKIQAAKQLANDIRLMQGVLREQGLDVALATQVALSLQTSQQLIKSQYHLESRRLIEKARQKHLDRQHSQKQHMEAIAATRYDPQWKDKLIERRNRCWDAVFRLIWEVAIAHFGVNIAKSGFQLYNDATHQNSIYPWLQLIVQVVCDCRNSNSTPYSGTESRWSPPSTSAIIPFLWQSVGWDFEILEKGTCYMYCVTTFICLSVGAFCLHHVLRAFSAPAFLHHMINCLALFHFYSPQNSTRWIYSLQWLSPGLATLVASMISLFAIVQWRFQQCLAKMTKCKIAEFATTLDQCLSGMDALKLQICLVRYGAVAIYCSALVMTKQSENF